MHSRHILSSILPLERTMSKPFKLSYLLGFTFCVVSLLACRLIYPINSSFPSIELETPLPGTPTVPGIDLIPIITGLGSAGATAFALTSAPVSTSTPTIVPSSTPMAPATFTPAFAARRSSLVCEDLRLTSPREGMVNGVATFY